MYADKYRDRAETQKQHDVNLAENVSPPSLRKTCRLPKHETVQPSDAGSRLFTARYPTALPAVSAAIWGPAVSRTPATVQSEKLLGRRSSQSSLGGDWHWYCHHLQQDLWRSQCPRRRAGMGMCSIAFFLLIIMATNAATVPGTALPHKQVTT